MVSVTRATSTTTWERCAREVSDVHGRAKAVKKRFYVLNGDRRCCLDETNDDGVNT